MHYAGNGTELIWIQSQLAGLTADAANEVRSRALEGLEKIIAIRGPGTIQELEALGVRPTQLRLVAGGMENNPNGDNINGERAPRLGSSKDEKGW